MARIHPNKCHLVRYLEVMAADSCVDSFYFVAVVCRINRQRSIDLGYLFIRVNNQMKLMKLDVTSHSMLEKRGNYRILVVVNYCHQRRMGYKSVRYYHKTNVCQTKPDQVVVHGYNSRLNHVQTPYFP